MKQEDSLEQRYSDLMEHVKTFVMLIEQVSLNKKLQVSIFIVFMSTALKSSSKLYLVSAGYFFTCHNM